MIRNFNSTRIKISAIFIFFTAIACGAGAPTATPTALPSPTATTEPSPIPSATETQIAATETPAVTPTEIADPVLRGEALAARFGCAVCHSSDGSPLVGPTWKGLYGSEETLADGSMVLVDENYLIESILDPNAKLTRGYPAEIMPQDYSEKLTDTDIEALILYIKSLGEMP